MSGIAHTVHVSDGGFMARMLSLVHVDLQPLMDNIGGIVESQSQYRVEEEKKAPDGTDWQEWSDSYAATRHENQSLLMSAGHLRDSIQHETDTLQTEIGSNLIYAGVHQEGMGRIPARPYLGIGFEDEKEIESTITEWIRGLMR
jgi:phage virion morphogenesis protein